MVFCTGCGMLEVPRKPYHAERAFRVEFHQTALKSVVYSHSSNRPTSENQTQSTNNGIQTSALPTLENLQDGGPFNEECLFLYTVSTGRCSQQAGFHVTIRMGVDMSTHMGFFQETARVALIETSALSVFSLSDRQFVIFWRQSTDAFHGE